MAGLGGLVFGMSGHDRARRLVPLGLVVALLAILLPVLSPPVSAGLYNPIPINDLGEPTYEFTDDDALFAYVTSDIKGGRVCVVSASVESPSQGSCDAPARWNTPNSVVGIGSIITLLEGPALGVGSWRLLTEDATQTPTALSEIFTVTQCDTCSREFSSARVQEWKERARSMRTGMQFFCIGAALADGVGGRTAARGVVKKAQARPAAYGAGTATFVGSIAPLSVSGLGMSFAIATVGDLIGSGEQKAKQILQDLSCAAGSMYNDIVNDPPDPEFDTIFAPAFVTLPATDSTSLTALLESLDAQTAHAEAALTSFERYLGAVQAGGATAAEREAAAAQAAAVADQTYAQIEQMQASARALRDHADELESLGDVGPIATPERWSDIQQIYARVTASGFTAEETQALTDLGLDSVEIDQIRTHFEISLEGFDPSISLPDQMRQLADTTDGQIDGLRSFAKEAGAIAGRRDADLTGNGAPVASDGAGTVVGGRTLQVSLIATFFNSEQGAFNIVEPPAHGALSDCQSGFFMVCTYTPEPGYLGPDSFTWNANDSYAVSNTATYTIGVVANNVPVASDSEISVPTGGSTSVLWQATDIDNDLLTFGIVDAPAHGQLTDCDSPFSCIYNADDGYLGPDTFTWKVNDGVDDSNIATVAVTVTEPCAPGACIDNGTVLLGINPEGHLNVASTVDGKPRGLTYLPTGNDSISAGCFCEGWGVADAATGVTGSASIYVQGIENLTLESFEATDTTATSTVLVGDSMRVTHHFAPSAETDQLYQVDVSVENISGATLDDIRYRRVMDWDIEPTPFSEYVTIETGNSSNVLFTSDDGFAYADPLRTRSVSLFSGEAVDSGPADHGALFDFGFGELPDSVTLEFTVFYGAADSEIDALNALNAVGAEAYSLGQPNTPDGATLGTPNTFMFAFAGVGGDPVFSPTAADDEAVTSQGTPVTIDVIANDSDPDGDPLEVTSAEPAAIHGTVSCETSGTCTYTPDVQFVGTDTFVYVITDRNGGTARATVSVTVEAVPNRAPLVDAGQDVSGIEGAAIVVAAAVSDPDGDPVTIAWSFEAGTGVDPGADCTFDQPTGTSTTVTCTDDGDYRLNLTADDGTADPVTASITLTVTNVDPDVSISEPTDGTTITDGSSLRVTAEFTDPGTNDTHTCSVDFGDGTTSDGVIADGGCTAEHAYTTAQAPLITVTITDDDGGAAQATVIVSAAGQASKVTGGGFIIDGGRLSFGLVVQAADHADSGQLQLRSGKDRFHGVDVSQLIVTGRTARFTGSGRWNGQGDYSFVVVLVDADRTGGRRRYRTPDEFSIEVRDPVGVVVLSASGPLKGGNLTIHG